jgi:hypothetical protein
MTFTEEERKEWNKKYWSHVQIIPEEEHINLKNENKQMKELLEEIVDRFGNLTKEQRMSFGAMIYGIEGDIREILGKE